MIGIYFLFTFHCFIGNIQSQLFAEREITVFETLRNVSFIANTNTSCPQVHVELIDNELRTKFNGHETWFEFKNLVRWPATISIDTNGVCDVTFNKRRHMHWNKDSIKKLNKSEVPLASVFPEYWMVEVVDNTNLTHDTCLLTVKHYTDVFNYFGPGQHLTIRQKIKGKVKKYQYTPVPMLPIVNPDNPNPGPGKSFLSNSLTYLIVKAYPQGTLSKWLCNCDMGKLIFVSEPQGTFCPSTELKGKKQIYLLAAGTGLTPMLSVILWILQTTRKTKVHLTFFNRDEEDIIWRKEIDETTCIDGRFTVEYVLSRPSETWKGRKGRISIEMLKEMFPVFDESNDSRFNYFGLCGQYEFSTQTEKWLIEDMGYPKKDVYKFVGQ